MIQHLNVLQMQFFALSLSLHIFIKLYLFSVFKVYFRVFFSSDVIKCGMCNIKKLM